MGEIIAAQVFESIINLVGLLFRPKEKQRERKTTLGKGRPGNFMNDTAVNAYAAIISPIYEVKMYARKTVYTTRPLPFRL
jgi:hypothetical protein